MILDLLKSNEFEFWLPLDICKSNGKADPTKRWVQGLASTEDRDLQDEEVFQRGIDFSYFLEHGYYNNDHKLGFENKVGQPVEAKITPEGFWTKGFLFQNHKVADAIWELAHALITSGAIRRLGFSIQGKVLRRAGKRILKCWVQDVAITAAPINTHTWLDVVKSLSAVPAEMWCESESGLLMPEDVATSIPCVKSCGGGCCKSENKALRQEDLNLFKKRDEEEEEAKALSIGYGHPMAPESLDSEVKRQTFGKSIPEILNFRDCVYLLQDTRGLSKSEATTLTEAIFAMNEVN
jgi:hypothetical protein